MMLLGLQDSLQTAKGPVLPDSSILLLRIPSPVLFVHGGALTGHSTVQKAQQWLQEGMLHLLVGL
jgi:hypothetical protein